MSSDLICFVEVVRLACRDNVGESLLVLGSDVIHAKHSGRLLAGDQTETGFTLDDAVSTARCQPHPLIWC